MKKKKAGLHFFKVEKPERITGTSILNWLLAGDYIITYTVLEYSGASPDSSVMLSPSDVSIDPVDGDTVSDL